MDLAAEAGYAGGEEKKMKKRYLIPLVVVGLLLLVSLIAFWQIDSIAQAGIEVAGETVMGVPTTVDGVSLKPFGGSAQIRGLTVGNPKGFETPHFMALQKSDAAFSLGNLMSDKVEIPSVTLDGMDVNLEKNDQGANYEVILANMKTAEEEPQEPSGKTFVVKEFVIRNVAVHADVTLGKEKLSTVNLKIKEIRLQDVGSDTEAGMVMSQLMGTIVQATLEAILREGHKVLPEVMVNGLGAGLKGLGKLGVGAVNVVADVGEGVGKAVGGVGKGVVEGVGGLFGGKKKKDEKKEEDEKNEGD